MYLPKQNSMSQRIRVQSSKSGPTAIVSNATKNQKDANRRPFTVYTNSKSFITKYRSQSNKCVDNVGYSIAQDEFVAYQQPDGRSMKEVKNEHRMILKNERDLDARIKYLSVRWEESPRDKYYYPAATSWRYGWVQPRPQTPKT